MQQRPAIKIVRMSEPDATSKATQLNCNCYKKGSIRLTNPASSVFYFARIQDVMK
jgi:hypothetical protein